MKVSKYLIIGIVGSLYVSAFILTTAFFPRYGTTPYKRQDFTPSKEEMIRRKELHIDVVASNVAKKITALKTGQ